MCWTNVGKRMIRGWQAIGAVALCSLAFGCGTQAKKSTPSEINVAPAMAAFETVNGQMDAGSDAVNSGAASTGTVGAMLVSNTIQLNVEQDAQLTAHVDLDKTDGGGNDRFPFHTGKFDVEASGAVTGSYSDDGSGSLNGSVDYLVDHTVTQDIVYTRGPYSASIGAGATAQHTLKANWAQVGAVHTHTITAHKVLTNVAVTVTGPAGTLAPTISCDVTAKSIRTDGSETENSVNGWWEASFSGGNTVRWSILAVDKPGVAGDVFIATVKVNGEVVSTTFSAGAFALRHPNCHSDLLGRFWLATHLRVDRMFSNCERGWNGWNKLVEGVSKHIDAEARANVSGTALDYQASVSGSVTFPTADCPNLSGTVSFTANGSVSTDGSTYANVNYGVTVTASTAIVYTPAAGFSATLAAGATSGFTLAVDCDRTDDDNYSVHLDVAATQTVPSLVVVTPENTTTLSSSFSASGTYDEVAASGVVSKSASLHAEWTGTASNSDGTVTAHKKVDLEITG